MKTKIIIVCLAAVLAAVVPASAEYRGDLYSYLTSTKMEPGTITAFGSTWVRNFTINSVNPNPVIGDNVTVQSFFDIFTEVSTDGGGTWVPNPGTGSITSTPSLRGVTANGVQTWNIGVSQLDASTPGLLFRESPTRSSNRTNTYVPVQDGYRISSFFDIFTEISTDGGMTWQPVTAVSANSGQTWTTGNLPMPIGVIQEENPVIIQSAINLFQPRIGTGQTATVNDFHVRFRVNRWERNGYNTFLGGPMNTSYLNPSGFFGPGTAVATNQSGDYIDITWTFPTMQISDITMPWFGFTFGNGSYVIPNGFRYQVVEWYWTLDGIRITGYDDTDPDVWQDWIKVWNPILCRWELQDVVVNRQTVSRSVALTAGSLMNPTTPLTIADIATGGPLPPNPVLPPPNPVLPGSGGTVVTPWPWPGADPYYYMYYEVANGPTPGASFRNAVVLVPVATCPSADLTGDCFVNFEDFAIMASQWLTGIR